MSDRIQSATLLLLIAAASLLGLFVASAEAETIYVCWDGSGDYLTIQEGIDAAEDGDEVALVRSIQLK